MAVHLAERGHDVHIITSRDNDLAENSYEKGFYVHRIAVRQIRMFGLIFFWVDIFRTIKKNRSSYRSCPEPDFCEYRP